MFGLYLVCRSLGCRLLSFDVPAPVVLGCSGGLALYVLGVSFWSGFWFSFCASGGQLLCRFRSRFVSLFGLVFVRPVGQFLLGFVLSFGPVPRCFLVARWFCLCLRWAFLLCCRQFFRPKGVAICL